MNEVYDELARALHERLEIIADEGSRQSPDAHMKRLQDASERIEALERQLPSDVDPQLRHFLQRRSYSKALDYLGALKGTTSSS